MSDRLNFMVLQGEDAGRALGCYGDPDARTPHLDQLAAEGCRYDLAFTTSPVCSPSRATVVTGQYPWTLGVHHHRSKLTQPPRLFTHELRDAGYYVNWANKTDFNFDPPADFADDRCEWTDALANGDLPDRPFFLYHNFEVTHESTMWPGGEEGGQANNRLVREHLLPGGEHIDPDEVHVPAYLPDVPAVRTNIARFYDALAIMDSAAGRMLEALDRSPHRDNTVVIYLTDHGRGLWREKRWLYGPGIHLSLLIRWPGGIEPASVSDELVSWVDLVPTILSLAGVPIPDHYQGQVFLGPDQAAPRDYVFAGRGRMDETFDHVRAARDRQYHYIRNYFPQLPWAQRNQYMEIMETTTAIRELHAKGELTGPPAQWMAATKPAEEFYDAEADPEMVRNLADDPAYREPRDRLRGVLDQAMEAQGDLGRLPERELIERGVIVDQLDELAARIEPLPAEQRIGPAETVLEMPA